jgi:polysaccharide export outer membrane protein
MGVFNIIKRSILAGLLVMTFAVANFSCVYAAKKEDPIVIAASDQFQVAQLSPGQLTEEYRLAKYDVINIMIVGFPNTFGEVDNSSNNVGISSTTTTTSSTTSSTTTPTATGANDIMIGPDGYVQLPYAGTVKLAGLTVREATDVLTQKLSEYMKIPSMTVMIKRYGPRKVYVMGEVKTPGIHELTIDSMNVYAAISSADGVATHGRPKHIQVLRNIGDTMYYKEVDMDAYVTKHDLAQNLKLEDGDIVYVPTSNKIDFKEDIMPYVTAIALYKTLTN